MVCVVYAGCVTVSGFCLPGPVSDSVSGSDFCLPGLCQSVSECASGSGFCLPGPVSQGLILVYQGCMSVSQGLTFVSVVSVCT